MLRRALLPAVASVVAWSSSTLAAPAHDICEELGPTLGVGVSSFSAAGDWPATAAEQYGVAWKFLYWYVVWNDDPLPDQEWWLLSKIDEAKALQATPVFTCYMLLQLGQANGLTGSEASVVQQVLQTPTLMKAYFERFIFLLQIAEKSGTPVLVQVEPDSWGFMMWSMGVEGNADATSIPVAVAQSGHPDVAAYADHAGGLGKALLELRDQYAPSALMGWHASNFRTGTRPEVAAGLYSSMGEWDVIVTEQPHLEADEAEWWLPWDEEKLSTNLDWFSTVRASTTLPVLMWQAQIGTTDWHLFAGDTTYLERFAKAGLGGVMFDMRGSGNPDNYRAYEIPALATVPPPGSEAGGTAKDMRARLASYSDNPLPWPSGSPCAAGAGGGAGSGGATGQDAAAGLDAAADAVAPTPDGSISPPLASGESDNGGCGCRTAHRRSGSLRFGMLVGLAALVTRLARWRRSQGPG